MALAEPIRGGAGARAAAVSEVTGLLPGAGTAATLGAGMNCRVPLLTSAVIFTRRLRQPDSGNPPGADVEISSAP